MRILIGTVEIAGQIPIFADGFRRLGHQVTTAICDRNRFYPEIQYDVNICPETFSWSWKVNRMFQLTLLPQLVTRHDVFVFQWCGTSLMMENRDYPLLKFLGKRIVSLLVGDDVRHSSAYGQEFDSITLSPDHSQRLLSDPLTRPLRSLRMAERYSDLILSGPNMSGLAVRPYMHFAVPLNLSEYEGEVKGREIPIVVHAPSNRSVKGTHLIVPALQRLRSEGVPFELRLLHDRPHQQVLAELADADVVIDQLHLPIHGKLGAEAMASGCALATCNREEYEPFPPKRPIWHLDPENLDGQLRRLLTDRELRVGLAREGRAYVERYHDHVQIAQRILDALSADESQRYDHYPTFFARAYQLPEAVVIPENLKRLTAQVVQRWGLPEGVDAQDMIARGLMSADGLNFSEPIPRWKPAPSAATI